MEEFAKKYLDILNGELKGLNLTRVNCFDDFYQKQIIDSVLPSTESEIFKDIIGHHEVILDVGFGGGFPILPLAKMFPDKKFIGFEARKKKSDAVNLIAEKLGLENVKTYHQRLEDVIFDKKCLVTFKAVSTIKNLLKMINIKKNISITTMFYKGPNLFELENMEDLPENWESIGFEDFELEGTEGRTLAYFQNIDVPRGTNLNKQLVRVSRFI